MDHPLGDKGAWGGILRRVAEDDGPTAFLDRAKQIAQVAETPGFRLLLDLVGQQRDRLMSGVVPKWEGDAMPTPEALHRQLGFVGGLEMVLDLTGAVAAVAAGEDEKLRRAAESADGEEQR